MSWKYNRSRDVAHPVNTSKKLIKASWQTFFITFSVCLVSFPLIFDKSKINNETEHIPPHLISDL